MTSFFSFLIRITHRLTMRILRFLKLPFSTTVCFILLISCMYGCGDGATEVSSETDEVSDEFRAYALDVDKAAIPFVDAVDEVELMKLEETEESLLSYVFRVSEVGDKFIFPGDDKGDIYAFSNKGEFLNKFNHNGDGPGEYNSIRTVWMEGDSIVLYDGQKQIIHWYDHNGKHLKELKMPEHAGHVYPYDGGYALDMTFTAISDSLKYKVLILDKDLETKKLLLPYDQLVPFPLTSTVNSFGRINGKLMFKSVFDDTTYFIGSNGPEPFFQIDFGDKYLWNDKSRYENGQAAMAAISSGNSVWIFIPNVGPRQIFLRYNTSFQDSGMILIDRKNGNYIPLDNSKNTEEKYGLGVVAWVGDRLLFSVPSSDVADFLGELDEGQYRFRERTTLESIESSENPVLMWVKFKTSFE